MAGTEDGTDLTGGAGGSGTQQNAGGAAPIALSSINPGPLITPASSSSPLPDAKGTPLGVSSPTMIDETRKYISYFLLGLLTLVILLQVIFGSVYSVGCWEAGVPKASAPDPCGVADTSLKLMSASLTPIFTAMVGLVGSVVGFYFGSKAPG